MIEGGSNVYGIGTAPLSDSTDRRQTARIYAIWAAGSRRRLPPPRNSSFGGGSAPTQVSAGSSIDFNTKADQ
jgi:hypothetical protein